MANKPPNKPPPDGSSGRNEYIPSFIASKPFYASDLLDDSDYLQHQRNNAAPKDTLDTAKWYSRTKAGPAVTKYRKGACENCGAATHKTKDCLSRKRKLGARWTGKDIQADETIEKIELGFDAKRDRWNGYDAREYDSVVKQYQETEALREAQASIANGEDGDDAHIAEETDMGRSQPTSTRQLRLREDTAGYLRDLSTESAKYDPKTRTLDKTAANINTGVEGDEGFVIASHQRQADPDSDAAAFEKAMRFAWDAQQKASTPQPDSNSDTPQPPSTNSRVHLQANPTASLLAHKRHLAEEVETKEAQKAYLANKYGGQAATTTTKAKQIPATSTEAYVEYDPETGRPIDRSTGKPVARVVPKSKYLEDVFPGNHTSVFGSFWKDFKWGYRCCHSFVRNSYCTGGEGKRAFEEEEAQRLGRNLVQKQVGGGTDAGERKLEEMDEETGGAKRLKVDDG